MRTDHHTNGHPGAEVSAELTVVETLPVAASKRNVRSAAVANWQHAVAAGQPPPSGAELARRYHRSPSWGRDVARQARDTWTATTPPGAPGDPPQRTGRADGVGTAPPPAESARSNGDMGARSEPVAGQQEDEVPGWIGRLRAAAVLLVATAAAVASVDHLADVAQLAGTTGWKVWLLPAAVDGLATAAALELYLARRTHQNAGAVVGLALAAGVGASVAGNVIAVYPELVDPGPLKIAVGATPPLSLALVLHLAFRPVNG